MRKLDLSEEERFKARRLKREMDEMGLPGVSEDQCFTFKGVIASLQSLSAEQLLAFRDGIAKVKSRGPIWRALQEPPTLKQKQNAIAKFRKDLDAIRRFAQLGSQKDEGREGQPPRRHNKSDVAIRDILLGADLAAELADTEEDALTGGHLDVAEWLAGAEKINALAKQLDEALRAPQKKSKRAGPVPVAPRTRLIGMALPNLYAKVFGRRFSPNRAPDIEFVQTCLALLGETKAGENFIRECVKLARKRARQQQGASARIGDHHRRIECGRGDLVATRSIRKVAPEALAEDEPQRLKAAEDAAVESAAWATALVERGGSLFGLWLD